MTDDNIEIAAFAFDILALLHLLQQLNLIAMLRGFLKIERSGSAFHRIGKLRHQIGIATA